MDGAREHPEPARGAAAAVLRCRIVVVWDVACGLRLLGSITGAHKRRRPVFRTGIPAAVFDLRSGLGDAAVEAVLEPGGRCMITARKDGPPVLQTGEDCRPAGAPRPARPIRRNDWRADGPAVPDAGAFRVGRVQSRSAGHPRRDRDARRSGTGTLRHRPARGGGEPLMRAAEPAMDAGRDRIVAGEFR
jgi:hypothetical protein